MAESDASPGQRAAFLRELVARSIAALETEGDAGVGRLCAAHPEYAEDVLHRLELLRAIRLLAAPRVHFVQTPVRERQPERGGVG